MTNAERLGLSIEYGDTIDFYRNAIRELDLELAEAEKIVAHKYANKQMVDTFHYEYIVHIKHLIDDGHDAIRTVMLERNKLLMTM